MGFLFAHNIDDIIHKYGCNIFVETGTAIGDTVAFMLDKGMDKLYSIELLKTLYDKSTDRFKDDNNVEIINDTSYHGLEHVMNKINDDDVILFWLDAHFPGRDFRDHHNVAPEGFSMDDQLPLEKELDIISRRKGKDVVIIDDLRVYEPGDYEGGGCPSELCAPNFGPLALDKALSSFLPTHWINRTYKHGGYITLFPR